MKKKIFLLGVTVMVLCLAAGCKKKEAETLPPVTVENVEDAGGEENTNKEEPAKVETPETDKEDKPAADTSETDKEDEPAADTSETDKEDEPAADTSETDKEDEPAADTSETDKEDEPAADTQELLGDVVSVGENSVVISQVFTSTREDGGELAVAAAPGSPDAVLINVKFSDSTKYQFQTVKNAGAEVDSREGSFTDIQPDLMLDLKGSWEGEEFLAKEAVISEFVH